MEFKMRFIMAFSLLILVPVIASACAPEPEAGATGLGDAYYPALGNGGYEVTHYSIDLDVDMEARTITGTVTIEATSEERLSSFNLDFSPYHIDEILVNGIEATFEQVDGELVIHPSTPLPTSKPFRVAVTYQGNPDDHATTNLVYGFKEGWDFYEDGAYVAGEPVGSSRWFPVNEHPLDKATYTLKITVPIPFEVASNGTLMEVIDGSKTRTYIWESRDPIANYLVTLGIGEYDIEMTQSSSGVFVRNYFDANIPEDIRDQFSRQDEMINYFESIFGPYPFEAYGALVLDKHETFALETQTLSIFFGSFVNEDVISHELAHQWFGDSVSLESWQDIWLNEGFASYAELLWQEHNDREALVEGRIRFFYNEMASQEGYLHPTGDPGPGQLFHPQVYLRGALTLHALREEVGDEVFFNILRTYADRYTNSNASTGDFVEIAENVSGSELSEFFDAWLYQTEIPDISSLDLFREDFVD